MNPVTTSSDRPTLVSTTRFDVEALRRDFPALRQTVHGKPLIYLDNAATALKPQVVLDAVQNVYARDCANVHRGVHALSQRATLAYEKSREIARQFLNAKEDAEVVFCPGTTAALNLVAQTYGRTHLKPQDEVLITGLEHHANIVPWQLVCQATGAKLVVAPVSDSGDVALEAMTQLIGERTRIVALSHASNTLGTILPVQQVTEAAHARDAIVVVDGAQAAPHFPIDVQRLGVDFYAFSGHKVYGPTGIGVLYGRREVLDPLPPYQGGGGMIASVSFEGTTYKPLPERFEAGTPNIAGAIGMGAALEYLLQLDHAHVLAHEQELLRYATERLCRIPGLRLIGTSPNKIGVLSFVVEGIHPHDLGTILDSEGVAIRTGHHCTQPLMERMGVPATARASFGLYNTREDVDALIAALGKAQELFG